MDVAKEILKVARELTAEPVDLLDWHKYWKFSNKVDDVQTHLAEMMSSFMKASGSLDDAYNLLVDALEDDVEIGPSTKRDFLDAKREFLKAWGVLEKIQKLGDNI